MSMPIASGGEGFPYINEGEILLESAREGILRDSYERFDQAIAQEHIDGHVYVQEAPLDTPFEDVMAVMLTKDGVRPFQEESDLKEQLILYIPSDYPGLIWIEHIRDGIREKFRLDKTSFDPVLEVEDILSAESEVEPQSNDYNFLESATPVSEMARLSRLREKINRFYLTAQD